MKGEIPKKRLEKTHRFERLVMISFNKTVYLKGDTNSKSCCIMSNV